MRPSVPAWAGEPSSSSSSQPSSSGQPAGQPGAASREASRAAARKIAQATLGVDLAAEEAAAAGGPHKPYTTPPGYKAPSMGEQFRYAAMKHPYAKLGYAAALATGLLAWALAAEEKGRHERHDGQRQGAAAGGGGGGK